MNGQKPPQDYAEILRRQYTSGQAKGKGRYQMSERHRLKLEKIRERVRQMRGQ
jgi:hypothetical protein